MSLHRGVITKWGRKYKRCGIVRATNKSGETACIDCGWTSGLLFDGEHVQYGLWGKNVYHEFYSCEHCSCRFCIVMVRRNEDYYATKR